MSEIHSILPLYLATEQQQNARPGLKSALELFQKGRCYYHRESLLWIYLQTGISVFIFSWHFRIDRSKYVRVSQGELSRRLIIHMNWRVCSVTFLNRRDLYHPNLKVHLQQSRTVSGIDSKLMKLGDCVIMLCRADLCAPKRVFLGLRKLQELFPKMNYSPDKGPGSSLSTCSAWPIANYWKESNSF